MQIDCRRSPLSRDLDPLTIKSWCQVGQAAPHERPDDDSMAGIPSLMLRQEMIILRRGRLRLSRRKSRLESSVR